MRSAWGIITVCTLMINLVVIGVSLKGAAHQRSEFQLALRQRDTLAERVQAYQSLRETQPDTIVGTLPQADFEQRISASLQAAGLSIRTRYSARTEADQEHRDARQQLTGLRQQRASVEIPGCTPAQIGSFLVDWQESQALWTPARIQVTHNQRSDRNLYTLRLECIAVYQDQGSE